MYTHGASSGCRGIQGTPHALTLWQQTHASAPACATGSATHARPFSQDVLFDCYNVNGKAGDKYWTRLKALVVHMCPESCESIWESTFGSQGSHATATDVSSASATGLSAANDADLGHTAQHLVALGPDLVAADSTRGKLWEGSMPVAAFATGS